MKGNKVEAKKEEIIDKESVKKAIDNAKAQRTPQQFIEAYKALCIFFGYQVVGVPQWKQSLDNGDYRLVIQTAVVEFKPQEQKK